MLAPSVDTIRLVLHLLGVAVWVGGQIVVGAIVPVVRRSHPEATRAIARGFSYAAWPGFALAVVTGLWSLAVVVDVAATSTEYQVTLLVKIMLVMTSGAAAFVHQIGTTKLAVAAGGAVALLAALAALVLGQTLTT